MQDNTLDDFLYWTTYICIIMFHIIGLEILICIPIYYAIFKRNKFYILDFTIKILFILIIICILFSLYYNVYLVYNTTNIFENYENTIIEFSKMKNFDGYFKASP